MPSSKKANSGAEKRAEKRVQLDLFRQNLLRLSCISGVSWSEILLQSYPPKFIALMSATFFKTAADFRAWLTENHATAAELQRGLDFIREADSMLVSTQTDHPRRELDTWAAFCQALLASNELRYVD